MFYKGGLVGGLLGRSSTDNTAGEKWENIFIIRYVWLWSNPEGKYFYPAFLEQHLDTFDYLLSLEIQFILNHLGFLFLFQWKHREICPLNQTSPLVLHQNIGVRLIDPRCLSLAKLSRLEGSQSFMWTFYADLVKLVAFFSPLFGTKKWITSAAGILGDRQRLAPQKKVTIILDLPCFDLFIYTFFALLSFLFPLKDVISRFL